LSACVFLYNKTMFYDDIHQNICFLNFYIVKTGILFIVYIILHNNTYCTQYQNALFTKLYNDSCFSL